jgi:hypothetical protein
MRLDTNNRRAQQREARLRREIEAPLPDNGHPRYQPSVGSLIDCKGNCGKVTMPSLRNGYCRDCAQPNER